MLNVSMGLRLYREMYNKSKEDLAKYLEIQPKAYARYESGEREPSLDKLYKLSVLYNCKVMISLMLKKVLVLIETRFCQLKI